MRYLNMILAATKDGHIGYNNTLPWKLKGDLKRFKTLTENKCVIMGRKTFESLGSKPLSNRINVVVSNTLSKSKSLDGELIVVNTITEAIAYAKNNTPDEAFLIGGVSLFDYGFKYANRIYLTEVIEYPDVPYDATILDFNKKINKFTIQNIEESGHTSHVYKTLTKVY